ncbi:MAG: hypothetical protein AAF447_27740 [Myxococcota bacterium]
MARGKGFQVCWLAALALGCGSDDAEVGICDADELVAALEAAEPGDVVQLGRCTVTGTFALQAGVELRGFGPESSGLDMAGRVGMRVSAGTAGQPSFLRNLRMTSRRTARAVQATGDGTGEVHVENVEIAVQAGAALVASGIGRLVVRQSTLQGALPDDPAGALDSVFTNVASAVPDPLPAASECTTEPVGGGCTPGVPLEDVSCSVGSCGPFERYCDACGREVVVASDAGLLAADVDAVEVEGLEVGGFVNFGLAHANAELGTTRVAASLLAGNSGTGVFVSGTSLALEDVEVTRHYERLTQSFAAVFVQNQDFPTATVRTDGLRLIDVSAYGVIQRGGSAEHVAPMTMNQQFPSFWAGEVDAFTVCDGMLTDGRLAGIVTVEARNVEIMDTTLQRTSASRTTIGQEGSVGAITMGDGIHAVATPDLFLEGVRFTNNERVGLLLDLGPTGAGDMPCVAGRGICIDSSNTVESEEGVAGALGARVGDRESAVVSRPVSAEGAWGASLERLGGAASDADLPADLAEQIVGAVAPIDRPRPDGAVAPID